MTMRIRQLKTNGMQQKQFQEGSLQQYNPTSRNTWTREPNFTPKTTGKISKKKKKNQQKERKHKDPNRNK